MKFVAWRVRHIAIMWDPRSIIGVAGLVMSVFLHELLHVILHIGHVSSVRLFSNTHTIAQVNVIIPHGYNMNLEELAAYSVSAITILITAMLVWNMHDKKDTKTIGQILAPNDTSDPSELLLFMSQSDVLKLR